MSSIVIGGAGGFIGGHLVEYFRNKGVQHIRAVDIKPVDEWYQLYDDVENISADLRLADNCVKACDGMDDVYNLACNMGGMGFIENHKAECMISVLINTNMLLAARDADIQRYFFSSTACVYNGEKQLTPDVKPLKEEDAYPALPEDGYGWEKLFSERLCRHFSEDFGMYTRVARFHNSYGPHGTWDGGREKAPAAICRKVIEAVEKGTGEIEIWGDGTRTRSFMYVDDNVEGIDLIMNSEINEPINLGTSEMVTINQLVDAVEEIAGVQLERKHKMDAPQGVYGRNSDNTKILEHLNWEPTTPLREGLIPTYNWIKEQYLERDAAIKAGKKIPANMSPVGV